MMLEKQTKCKTGKRIVFHVKHYCWLYKTLEDVSQISCSDNRRCSKMFFRLAVNTSCLQFACTRYKNWSSILKNYKGTGWKKVRYKNGTLAWKRKQYVCYVSLPAYPLPASFKKMISNSRFTWNIISTNMWNNKKINFRKWQDRGSNGWLFLQVDTGFTTVAHYHQKGSAFLSSECSAKNFATKKI